ncbi:hypothetical protein G6F23_014922 [Rhizopus arrhizus]|nr:hypothetical protein G6F23_014922 [Rhizopus arrhizus]
MLDLAQIHSLTLGYRWSPPKCAVLNAPTATSSRFVSMSLYGQDLPTTEEFTYLGVPFDGKGISVTAMIKHRASGTLAAMAQLHSMGLNRQGFPLLLSSRLFAATMTNSIVLKTDAYECLSVVIERPQLLCFVISATCLR